MGATITRTVKFSKKGDKGDAAVTYGMVASATAVSRSYDANGNAVYSPSSFAVYVTKTTGKDTGRLSSLPPGFSVKYRKDDGTVTEIAYSNVITVSSATIFSSDAHQVNYFLYNDNNLVVATVSVTLNDSGKRGATLRGPQAWSDCANNYSFQAGGYNEEFKDVVLYNGNYYSCIKSHTKSSSNYPGSTADTNNHYWQLGDKVELVASNILLATYALVKNLGVEAIDMKDGNGNILFRAKDGVVTCKTGNFENISVKKCLIDGVLASPFVVENATETWIDGVSYYAAKSHDNLLYNSASHQLYWAAECSGRLITLCHHESVTGSTTFNAPSGKYFYEDGQKKTSITVSRQCVLLKGYGTGSTFLGYIVIKRIDLAPTRSYGMPLKCLAMGLITGTSSGATISYRTFDLNVNTLAVSRTAAGVYQVTIPTAWNIQSDRLRVMATAQGTGGTGVLYAGVKSIETSNGVVTGFTLETGDDDSRNDGKVQFMLFNQGDWEMI